MWITFTLKVIFRNPHSKRDCLSFSNMDIYTRELFISIRDIKDNFSLLQKEPCSR